MNTNISSHVAASYRAFRLGIAIIAFVFPPLLYVGGLIFGNGLPIQGSMSAYYHARVVNPSDPTQTNKEKEPPHHPISTPGTGVMRNTFVGLLFALGIALFLYHGFSKAEDYALNAAGCMALGVAIFPTNWGEQYDAFSLQVANMNLTLHGFCAVTLFLCISFVCIKCAKDTLDLIPNETVRRRYARWYRILGWSMAASPVTAAVLISVLKWHDSYTFVIEAVGIYVFATYWLLKSTELQMDQVSAQLKHRQS